MDWLRNWDDLVHGTVVFGAALPFVVAAVLGAVVTGPRRWLACPAALIGSYLWFFGLPGFPPRSSDDVAVTGLVLAAGLVALGSAGLGSRGRGLAWAALWAVVWAGFFWLVYPAWLAQDGGVGRKLLVAGGLGFGVAVLVAGTRCLFVSRSATGSAEGEEHAPRLTLAAFIPPLVALAVLLQLGGASRFGQSAGAVAAVLSALVILAVWRPTIPDGVSGVAALAAALFGLFAACGWLFAEVRWGLALLVSLAPVAAWLVRTIPIPRAGRLARTAIDFIVSALVAASVVGVAVADYLEGAAASEGY